MKKILCQGAFGQELSSIPAQMKRMRTFRKIGDNLAWCRVLNVTAMVPNPDNDSISLFDLLKYC